MFTGTSRMASNRLLYWSNVNALVRALKLFGAVQVSAAPPEEYGTRLVRYVETILH